MTEKYLKFAELLVAELFESGGGWQRVKNRPDIISIENHLQQLVTLNLTPFNAEKSNTTVIRYFEGVRSINGLISAYNAIRKSVKFEAELSELSSSSYAEQFLESVFNNARETLNSDDVMLIVNFVKNLDCYTAVKSIESLFYSHSDLMLLRIAKTKNWSVHFDHVAIRCGSSENDSAKQVAELLIKEHGYRHPQINTEKYYLFDEGWSAYPLYKILANGQVLRLFIDQSEHTKPSQIIQHWNFVYGFTAHHLAIRLSKITGQQRIAIELPEIIALMTNKGRDVLSATGYYTQGLLSQVFTKPEKNTSIPDNILIEKKRVSSNLPEMLYNAKLLEIVSRKEVSAELAKRYYALYDIEYRLDDDLHSAVYYQYFLPAQAAHVINSSIQV